MCFLCSVDIPIPVVQSVSHQSQSRAEVILAGYSTCVGAWGVNITVSGDSQSATLNGLSSTSTVIVEGLDVCRFIYSVVGYVVTPGGVVGEAGTPFTFLPDLTSNAYLVPIKNGMFSFFVYRGAF